MSDFKGVNDPDSFAPSLLYNYTMRVGHPSQEEKDTPSVPLTELEEVVLNGRYKDRRGYIVTLTKEIGPGAPEYIHGYRFHGSNHLIYRRYGETTSLNHPTTDDLVAKVVDDQGG